MTVDKTHILLGACAALLALFGVYAIEARIADRADARAQLATQHAADLEKQNAAFQAETQAQIAALQSALNAREAIEAKQATQNGSLTAPQVAQQIAEVAKVPQATVVAAADSVTFPLPLAQVALTDMQLVPMLTQDKADLSKQLDLEKAAHASDVQVCTAQVSAAKAETKAAIAKGRKAWLKGFFVGLVAGFVGGRAA